MIQLKTLPTLPSLLYERYKPLIHRDLSWLQFNDRVLAEARPSSKNPLLERAKFLAISYSNLDEFFMIRLPSIDRGILGAFRRNKNSKASRVARVRSSILENVARFGAKQVEVFDLLVTELGQFKIFIPKLPRETDPAYELGKAIFDSQILPHMGPPQGFSLGKVSSVENLALAVIFPENIWFQVPKTLPSVYLVPGPNEGEQYIFFLDHLLRTHLGKSMRLQGDPGVIRVTRDGDFALDLEEEDTESIPDVVRTGLNTRDRGRPVRLQCAGNLSSALQEKLALTFRLNPARVFLAPQTMLLQGLWSAVNQISEPIRSRSELTYPKFQPLVPLPFQHPESLYDILKQRDILLHHPYDSFDAYVTWIRKACEDPNVVAIEQTVYRTDVLSPVVDALKEAASRKKVRVVIELRARFDELNNLRLADELRKAGVEVAFGFGKLKLHAKISLVTHVENGVTRFYTHLSTGNYNATTARQYTDLAIMTSDQDFGEDARKFFDSVWAGEVPSSFKKLVPAPLKLHRRILHHIETETQAAIQGKPARIVAKVNALVDESITESLYRASRAGVKVDLIVRGACSLVPGVKGLSENIRVVSLVDRFLEHSRIYYFENAKVMYLSSADWMPRNFFSRLEIAFPVLDPGIYRYLSEVVIPVYLGDTVKAKELTPQGTWKKTTAGAGKTPIRSQFYFEELAKSGNENTNPNPPRASG